MQCAYAMISAPRVAAPSGSPAARGIWAVVVLGLVERLHRRRRVRAHRHVRDVHVLVLHLHEAEVLLGLLLARSSNQATIALNCSLSKGVLTPQPIQPVIKVWTGGAHSVDANLIGNRDALHGLDVTPIQPLLNPPRRDLVRSCVD